MLAVISTADWGDHHSRQQVTPSLRALICEMGEAVGRTRGTVVS